MNYNTKNKHISTISAGDTIVHNNELRTVCNKDITRGFCGVAIFGDSYRAGVTPVVVVTKFN